MAGGDHVYSGGFGEVVSRKVHFAGEVAVKAVGDGGADFAGGAAADDAEGADGGRAEGEDDGLRGTMDILVRRSIVGTTDRNVYRTATDRNVYRTATDRNVYRTATDKNVYRTATDRNVYRTATDRNVYRTATDRNVYRTATDKNVHRTNKFPHRHGFRKRAFPTDGLSVVFAKRFQFPQTQRAGDDGVVAECRMGIEGEVGGVEGDVVFDEKTDNLVIFAGDAREGLSPTQTVVYDTQIRANLPRLLEKFPRRVNTQRHGGDRATVFDLEAVVRIVGKIAVAQFRVERGDYVVEFVFFVHNFGIIADLRENRKFRLTNETRMVYYWMYGLMCLSADNPKPKPPDSK